jgi:hypothetical protein
MMNSWRAHASASWLLLLMMSGCAGPTLTSGTGQSTTSTRAYPGPCSKYELDVVETSASGRGIGAPNLGDNSLEVVATYRPGAKPKDSTDVISFREQDEEDDNPEAQLKNQTFVACGGESAVGVEAHEAQSVPLPSKGGQ